jgi:hypothetical protein
MEIHAIEPLVAEPRSFKLEIATMAALYFVMPLQVKSKKL